MKGFYTILLLIVSNVFMTFAWYGHLKMKQEYSWFAALPLIGVITFSWVIAFFEYSCQIPANRIGFVGNGGPFSLMQLKVIQEVITLIIFTVFTTVFFKGETLHWNHLAAFVCLIGAVYFGILLLIGLAAGNTTLAGNSWIFSGGIVCAVAGMVGGMLAPVSEG